MDTSVISELENKFTPKHELSEVLAYSYKRLGDELKASRVFNCGTFLEFKASSDSGQDSDSFSYKLSNANFCRDRLCPMCNWRRSYKIFSNVSRIMDVIADDYYFLFLTLTVPNCKDFRLCSLIDDLQLGFNKLTKYKRFKKAVCGYFKVLEITRNLLADTYHPHFHCILAVNKSYFTSRDYINHDEWLQMWRKAMKDNSITQVDVRRCKPKEDIKEGENAVKALKSAVAEVTKYAVKASDYLGRLDKSGFLVDLYPDNIIDSAVLTLSGALRGRRLTSFGGVFSDTFHELQLDDSENGDLVHVDSSDIRSDVAVMIYKYRWSCGVYKLVDVCKEVNVVVDCDDVSSDSDDSDSA